MAGDDSQDDGERTRIGGLPPSVPKPPQTPAAPASATPPAAEEPAERTVIAPARPPGVPPAPAVAAPPAPPAPDEAGERTTIAPARPPGLPPAAGVAAPPAAEEAGERTTIAPARPPGVAPGATGGGAAPTPEVGDRTQLVAAPPPGTARAATPAAPSAVAPPAAPPAAAPVSPATPGAAPAPAAPAPDTTVDPARPRAAAADDDERTVVLQPRKVESTVRLERIAPKGTEETIPLDRPSLLLGRGHGCDVKLRTPTASREHAKIVFKGGQWLISGVEGKSFYADGARQAGEVALRGGMRIRLGDDEFEVVDTAGGAASRSGGGLWARLTAFVRGLFGRRS